ncbi:MAG TPA: hypothetical protein VFI31_06380 [Pirellulales bacterium]|nr:hypothetical protein [Pirellulales bacterium]
MRSITKYSQGEFESWRATLLGGRYSPLLILFAVYLAFHLLTPCLLYLARSNTRSGMWHYEVQRRRENPMSDGLGGRFAQFNHTASTASWVNGVVALICTSAMVQRAMFAVWVAFGSGRWLVRLALALAASACLYAIMQWQIGLDIGGRRGDIDPFMLMPMEMLSLTAIPAGLALWSGRRLRPLVAESFQTPASQHFSLLDVLALTAVVAASLAPIHAHDVKHKTMQAAFPESLIYVVYMLVFSTFYMLPTVWSGLAIRRQHLALSGLAAITGLLSTPLIAAALGPVELVGNIVGLFWTAPASVLLWRFCGYRLLPASTS